MTTPEKSKKLSPQTINFISGGIAGSFASTITTPLEVVKTQLQSSLISGKQSPLEVCRKIIKQDGPLGFFKGIGPTLIGIIPTRAIYFWAYSTSKSLLSSSSIGDSSLTHLISAFAAGITSNTITNPIWMVKTRFQLFADPSTGQRAYKSYLEVIKSIWREEGPPGFFKGLSASYVGCIEGAVHWLVYEKIKASLVLQAQQQQQSQTQQPYNKIETKTNTKAPVVARPSGQVASSPKPAAPSASSYFFAAAVSKFIAICATYPHEVVRTRLREQATNGAFKYKGFVSTLVRIGQEDGVRGLYGGLGMHLLRSVPNAAIMFATFEMTNRWMLEYAEKEAKKLSAATSGSAQPAGSLNEKVDAPKKKV